MTQESQMIDGNEFLLPPLKVVREKVDPHQCVCLLVEQTVRQGEVKTIRDKCHQLVDNPDQPFCEHCENALHPQATTQSGLVLMKETK